MASNSGSRTQVHTHLRDPPVLPGKQSNTFQAQGRELGSNQVSSHNILGLGIRPHVNIQETDQLSNSTLTNSTHPPQRPSRIHTTILSSQTLTLLVSIQAYLKQFLSCWSHMKFRRRQKPARVRHPTSVLSDTIPQILAILPLRKDGPMRVTLGVKGRSVKHTMT